MTAVAEQAMNRLTESVETARAEADGGDPLAVFEAIGHGYLRWALANPTHFAVISSRTLIDFNSSDILREQNDAIRRLMISLLTQARGSGQLAPGLDLTSSCWALALWSMALPAWRSMGIFRNGMLPSRLRRRCIKRCICL